MLSYHVPSRSAVSAEFCFLTEPIMKLRHTPRSPFVRKVMVLAHEHGLVDDFKVPPRGSGYLIEVARHYGDVHDR